MREIPSDAASFSRGVQRQRRTRKNPGAKQQTARRGNKTTTFKAFIKVLRITRLRGTWQRGFAQSCAASQGGFVRAKTGGRAAQTIRFQQMVGSFCLQYYFEQPAL